MTNPAGCCEKREKTMDRTASRRTLQRGPNAIIGLPRRVRKRKMDRARRRRGAPRLARAIARDSNQRASALWAGPRSPIAAGPRWDRRSDARQSSGTIRRPGRFAPRPRCASEKNEPRAKREVMGGPKRTRGGRTFDPLGDSMALPVGRSGLRSGWSSRSGAHLVHMLRGSPRPATARASQVAHLLRCDAVRGVPRCGGAYPTMLFL